MNKILEFGSVEEGFRAYVWQGSDGYTAKTETRLEKGVWRMPFKTYDKLSEAFEFVTEQIKRKEDEGL